MIRDADNAPHRRSHQHDSAGGRRRDSDREGPSDADHLRQHTRGDGAGNRAPSSATSTLALTRPSI